MYVYNVLVYFSVPSMHVVLQLTDVTEYFVFIVFMSSPGVPCITDCVMAELEKLGSKYRVALRYIYSV